MRHTILNGDVIACLRSLPDACVQCVVTSPPYWGLRDYGVEGQIGLEPTPEAYVEKMVEVFREVRRVLRDDGTLWLNLGDSYASGGMSNPSSKSTLGGGKDLGAADYSITRKVPNGLKPKDLVGIPWRVAFALQADGWYLRSDIIWSKPNPMPESVTDRPTKSHEYVFLLSKRPRYFYDVDAIREEQTGNAHSRGKGLTPKSAPEGSNIRAKESWHLSTRDIEVPRGRNRRTVWEIPTQPMPEAHFATFPEALVEPCIKAGTSARGACPECGAPWRRVAERRNPTRTKVSGIGVDCDEGTKGRAGDIVVVTTGWQPSCACGCEETVPCTVLDPFAGSGTVSLVAHGLGRSSVGIELNEEYIGIIKSRWARGGLPAEALEVRAI